MDLLINKQYKPYSYLSRYSSFPFYYHTIDNKYIYGTTSHLNKDIPYTLYKVLKNDTLDSIALYFYNNPTYFWVICDFNDIQDPYIELEEGQLLKIPSLSNVSYISS